MQNRLSSGGRENLHTGKMGFVVGGCGSEGAVKIFRRLLISVSATTLDLNLLRGMTAKIDSANKVPPCQTAQIFLHCWSTAGPSNLSNCRVWDK